MKTKDERINYLAKKAMDNIIFKSMSKGMAIATLGKITPKEALQIGKILDDKIKRFYYGNQ